MRIPPFNPYIAIVIGVIAVSTSAIFVKLTDDTPAGIIAFYRLFIASLIMAPIIFTNYRHELRLIQKKNWIYTILAGIFLAIHYILWFESLQYTTVLSSVVFVTTQPLFIFIISFILTQERFSSGSFISFVITIFGSVILIWGDFDLNSITWIGNLLALAGAMSMAIYLVFGKQTRKDTSLMTYTFIVYIVSSVTLLFYNIIMGNNFTGYHSFNWAIFVALAIIPTFFGQSLFNWALKWLNNSTVSMAMVFEPVGASLLAYYILGENIQWYQVLGGSIVIFGLFLFILSTSRKTKVTISRKRS